MIKCDVQASAPYQKFFTDIPEIHYAQGQKAYITAYMDLFSGEILAHHIQKRPTA
ncbi:transposase family protein [Weissella coleopterorum]|uniref:Transposase family protein n=1 Tax=Weissella coleopterorum TaxID=2714949 RepID=A0A6G8AY76_9LACO|nr:transposase family protein [Weissella coleopterorum]QIL50018.1 transposase family protein [Weissella coleopterorum]